MEFPGEDAATSGSVDSPLARSSLLGKELADPKEGLKRQIASLSAEVALLRTSRDELQVTVVQLTEENIHLRAKLFNFTNPKELMSGLDKTKRLIAKSERYHSQQVRTPVALHQELEDLRDSLLKKKDKFLKLHKENPLLEVPSQPPAKQEKRSRRRAQPKTHDFSATLSTAGKFPPQSPAVGTPRRSVKSPAVKKEFESSLGPYIPSHMRVNLYHRR